MTMTPRGSVRWVVLVGLTVVGVSVAADGSYYLATHGPVNFSGRVRRVSRPFLAFVIALSLRCTNSCSMLPSWAESKLTSPPTVGTPTQLP